MIYILLLLALMASAAIAPASVRYAGEPSMPPGAKDLADQLMRFALICLIPAALVTLVVGLRDGVGTDFYRYVAHFEIIRDGADIFFREPGYTLLARVAAHFQDGQVVFFMLCAAVTNAFLFYAIYRNGYPCPALVIALLFALGAILMQTNQVRHAMAMAVLFLGLSCIWKGQFVRYSLLVGLAASFHYTALIFYPLYWLARIRLPFFYMTVLCGLSLVLLFSYPVLMSALEVAAPMLPPQYAHYLQEMAHRGPALTSGLGILLIFMGGYVALFLLHHIGPPLSVRERVIANLTLLGLLMHTALANVWALNRLSDYLIMFLGVLMALVVAREDSPPARAVLFLGFLSWGVLLFFVALLGGSHGAIPYRNVLLP
ncbi:EpsG family protein [Ectothiorhodospira haloalkaliphila]|uniref:EpsG family protein n=1 Tax=Ectothiorhodospira haloalkaliphila TaxID=421628 RepID=UPI001EE81A95|nr:EpsG family protein [Ectothiorhodospira haloalkaliphila]MCG5526248.1 EpsG family protein [Ectothiorhodospira haloalkaliphila]